jgi:hypothetical protein
MINTVVLQLCCYKMYCYRKLKVLWRENERCVDIWTLPKKSLFKFFLSHKWKNNILKAKKKLQSSFSKYFLSHDYVFAFLWRKSLITICYYCFPTCCVEIQLLGTSNVIIQDNSLLLCWKWNLILGFQLQVPRWN